MVWCSVVWSGVMSCGVVWCGVVWCAEGAVTRRQWPGCLPTGTGKRAGLCVLCARRVYVCRSWWREGEPGRPGRLALLQELPLHSLSLHLLVQAQLLQCPCHRAARAQAGLQQRGTRLGVGVLDPYRLLYDVAEELRAQRAGPRTFQVVPLH